MGILDTFGILKWRHMNVVASQIKGTRLFVQQLFHTDKENIIAPHKWPLVRRIDDGFFSQRTSIVESVSMRPPCNRVTCFLCIGVETCCRQYSVDCSSVHGILHFHYTVYSARFILAKWHPTNKQKYQQTETGIWASSGKTLCAAFN